MKFASKEEILKLIIYILKIAHDYGEIISKTQLIKFLYLADLIFARRHGGRTWTGWQWRYWHFGPYCEEAVRSIQDAACSGFISLEEQTDGEKEFEILKLTPKAFNQKIDVPVEFEGLLPKWIKKYGGDLYRLLDFIYHNTEPMIEAEKGQILDFSHCLPSTKLYAYGKELKLPPMSKKKKELLKRKIKNLTKIRLAKEQKQRSNNKLPPGISPSQMLELLQKFDEWCDQA